MGRIGGGGSRIVGEDLVVVAATATIMATALQPSVDIRDMEVIVH